MKIVRKKTIPAFLFACKECKSLLEASAEDFKFVKRGVLQYTCPKCNKDINVKERKITAIDVYEELVHVDLVSENEEA